eukprot:gene26536-35203_t
MSFSNPPLKLSVDDESVRRHSENSDSSTCSVNYVIPHQSYNITASQDSSFSSESVSSNESSSEFDPTSANGLRIIYDREVPFEVRRISFNGRATGGGVDDDGHSTLTSEDNSQDCSPLSNSNMGVMQSLKVKVLLLGAEDAPRAVQIELSSETDLFFHFLHAIEEKTYVRIQENQRLMVEFSDYATVLVRMLNACIREPQVHLAIFTMHVSSPTNEARIDFIQNMEYKYVELLFCTCVRSPQDVVQRHIASRYNFIKQQLASASSRLSEIHNLVKLKNPSLLLQLQKNPPPPLPPNTSSSAPTGPLQGHGQIHGHHIGRLGK